MIYGKFWFTIRAPYGFVFLSNTSKAGGSISWIYVWYHSHFVVISVNIHTLFMYIGMEKRHAFSSITGLENGEKNPL